MTPSGKADAAVKCTKRDAAICTKKLFLYTNYALLTASLASIVTMLLLKLSPTAWGFLLLLLDTVTVISGIAGYVSCREPRCYTFHVITTAATAILHGVVSLFLFTRTELSLRHLRSAEDVVVRRGEGVALVKMKAGLSLVLFCVQWVGLGLAWIVHYCTIGELYVQGRNCSRVGGEPPQPEPQNSHVIVVDVAKGIDGDKNVRDSKEFEKVDL